MELRDKTVEINKGEFIIVLRGVKHKTEETTILNG